MKYFFKILVLLLFVAGAIIQPVAGAFAAPLHIDSVHSFSQLGSPEIILHGPYGTGNFRFNLPAHWALQDGVEMRLMISSFFTGDGSQVTAADDYLGAMLDVYFNGELQQSIPLRSGNDILYTIPVRSSDLASPRKDGSLEISFFLNASIDCDYGYHHTTVLISAESQLFTPYEVTALKMDLRRLPWPIYQPSAEEIEPATVVIPATASADELQAAFTVMSSFARLTNGELPMNLVSADKFTDEIRQTSDIIFVGTPQKMDLLKGLDLPISIKDFRYNSSEVQEDDGIMQMIPSPWNPDNTLLIISGNNGAGIVKAAHAFSTGRIQVGTRSSYSVVADVLPISVSGVLAPETSDPLKSADFTLADLGYGAEDVVGIGVNWISYEFILPAGQIPVDKSYLDLSFSNSALVDPERSGFVVYLNSDLVGSARFTEESSNLSVTHVNIPFSSLRPGRNKIDVAANLIPRDVCSIASFNGLWMSIFPESVLHLPLKPAVASAFVVEDIKQYPYPFLHDPSYATTMFVLPAHDANAWSVAASLAYEMGERATGAVIDFEVTFDDSSSEPLNQNYDLIFVGMPKDLPALYDMKDTIPAFFEPNSNIAVLKDQQVVYRISEEKSLGYLQLFTPPWSENVSVLAVLGTTPEGVTFAGNALVDPKLRSDLKGNFAAIDGEQAIVADTRTGLGTGRLPSIAPGIYIQATPAAEYTGDNTGVPPAENNKQLILWGMVFVLILMVIIGGIAFLMRGRQPGN